jgi:hypothetical protein
MINDTLTLSDVLARGIAVDWYESVAVVRAVAEVLTRDPENARLPELHQVQISAAGRVNVIAGTAVQEPVRRLGQLLQATLGQAEPPVQLRLLVSQATAPIPAYASIAQYDEALGYFERPGRIAVLQALYLRASQAAVVTCVEKVPSLDIIAPLPAPLPSKNVKATSGGSSTARNVRVVSAGTLLVLLCGAAVGYRGGVEVVDDTSHRVSASATHGLHVAGAALVRVISWATERVGLGRLVSSDAAAVDGPTAVSAAPDKPLKSERRRPAALETAPSQVAQTVSSQTRSPLELTRADTTDAKAATPGAALTARIMPFEAFDLEPEIDSTSPRRDARVAKPALSNRASRQDDEATGDAAIYSLRSESVSPPIAVRPQLPRQLSPNVNRSDLRVIELVISPLGTVESVRLIGAPRDVHDSMLLSAAKAWVFRPAEKDGVAVRYRKTVSVAPRS